MTLQLNTANYEHHSFISREAGFGLNLELKVVVKCKTGQLPVTNFVVTNHGGTAYEGTSLDAAVSAYNAIYDQQTLVF